jgi:hypothetical protein
MDTITLKEAIECMDNGEKFSIGFRTYNKREDTGGEYIFFDECYKSKLERNNPSKVIQPQHYFAPSFKKDPRHFENGTRNIVVLPEGNIVKVHLRLIRRFNSKTVS